MKNVVQLQEMVSAGSRRQFSSLSNLLVIRLKLPRVDKMMKTCALSCWRFIFLFISLLLRVTRS